jgi:hypothetical protein
MGIYNPATHVQIVLVHHLRREVPFKEAWTAALRSLPRDYPDIDLWRASLQFSRPMYAAAYAKANPEPISPEDAARSERRCIRIQERNGHDGRLAIEDDLETRLLELGREIRSENVQRRVTVGNPPSVPA